MNDPRLDETHLDSPRRECYVRTRDEVLGSMGPTTGDVEEAFRARQLPFGFVPAPARYALRDVRTGRLYLLRVGVNTVGRHADNDIVLPGIPISRRHCVVLVRATGGCEVRDTASRNGVRIGHRQVAVTALAAGDILRVCDYKFMLLAEPTDGPTAGVSGAGETGSCGDAGTG